MPIARLCQALSLENGYLSFVEVAVSQLRASNLKSMLMVFAAAQAEIIIDVRKGLIPCTVKSFSELHDYVDANEYGGICELPLPRWMDDQYDVYNVLQGALDDWIHSGALAALA